MRHRFGPKGEVCFFAFTLFILKNGKIFIQMCTKSVFVGMSFINKFFAFKQKESLFLGENNLYS